MTDFIHTTRLVLVMVPCVLFAAVGGCAGPRATSPYTAASDMPRDPRRADLLNSKAADLMNTDPIQAEQLLREALTADLYHAASHNNFGVLLLRKGDLYGAAGEFEWAGKLLPGHPDPRLNLALTLETAGRTDDALTKYRHALEVRPGHIPSVQALTRLEVTSNRRNEETPARLRTIALEGETTQWKEWARMELAKSRGNAEGL